MNAENSPRPINDVTSKASSLPLADSRRWRLGLGVVAMLLAGLALVTPLLAHEVATRVGLLLVLAAVVEFAHGLRRSTPAGRRAAWSGGAITLAMGLLLLSSPLFVSGALVLLLAGWFGLDGARYLVGAFHHKGAQRSATLWVFAGLGNLLICATLFALRNWVMGWTVALAGALRIFGTASNIFLWPVFSVGEAGETVVRDLGLPDDPEVQMLAARLTTEESARASIDWGWIAGFIATLFSIHVARMGFDRTFLGVMSPGFAVLGDLFIALLLAFLIVIPARVASIRLAGPFERRAWAWLLSVPHEKRGWMRRTALAVLTRRLRVSIWLRQVRYSLGAALRLGLQIGLPLAAIIAATVPVWGISWYFDTENWAAGIWNSWAEERTDTWREAMVRALAKREPAADPARAFDVSPPGVVAGGDFSFLVIGDTGEGDASQHSLRAQFLEVVRRDEVKFVVISSDVVYPTGAMRDYERNFWLPFMGTTKPVYAIPGNHDWYDALEGFTASFFEPAAARIALRARVDVDNGITSTTEGRIEELILQATRLGREYGVTTQLQQAPFFQFQTESFALFAVDTGVARRVDPTQGEWLRRALDAARGKLKMAILGHPFYAGGDYLAPDGSDFAALHALLREHDVAIVMAGDTHDFEYYAEKQPDSSTVVHHFVNGGGGAYLSFGTSLAWPAKPASDVWAFYPAKAQVVAKIEATSPRWKRPAWWWTKHCGAWPFSAEWLSAAFDVNVAPFYQSFVEISVEPSQGRVRVVPYGIHGRLRWSDMQAAEGTPPRDATPDTFVEWTVALPPRS